MTDFYEDWIRRYNKGKAGPGHQDAIVGVDSWDREDLEEIAASARDSAGAATADFSAFAQSEFPDASEVVKKQAVAEMNAVAEEFVAEQRHHAPASAAASGPDDVGATTST